MKVIKYLMQFLLVAVLSAIYACNEPEPIRALIVSGQNNHNWKVSHRAIKQILDNSGMFVSDVVLTTPAGGDMSRFNPNFDDYDVVVLDYNGDRWGEKVDEAFLKYVQKGGGIIVYHAADNAFAGWDEFNKIIALGGWEGRDEKSGPYCYIKDGKMVLDSSPGRGGSHGRQREYPMHCRNAEHPITKDLPDNWLHAQDEMYDFMRGPANIKDLLYSGKSDAATGGSGREEPLVFTVDYGKARIFHIMLGHCGASLENNPAMQCAGFQTLLLRGAEWAATGKVTQPVPNDFPTNAAVSLRKDYGREISSK
ncbi:MAG: ThuA domain-containing protein [Bacteroidaceae bacterium]|nr:ThuA domain-containing protein [Bacteroidaceae bacterium]